MTRVLYSSLLIVLTIAGCQRASDRKVTQAYERATGRLVQLSADQNADGLVDQWTYLDGNRPLRGEADTNGDGRIDVWEYFDENAQLVRVGSSSAQDGIEDRWTLPAAANELRQVELSRARDRHVDRREFYRGELLERVEEDTNRDGRVDKWERYDSGVLREATFDTSFANGRPDRRLLFDAQGRFQSIEDDSDRDGVFVALTGEAAEAAKAKAGVQR